MNDPDFELIRALGDGGDARSLDALLLKLDDIVASIPECCGSLPDGELDPSIAKAEAVAKALEEILRTKGNDFTAETLTKLARLPDVSYSVYYYFPPVGIAETGQLAVSFASVRKLAGASLSRKDPV